MGAQSSSFHIQLIRQTYIYSKLIQLEFEFKAENNIPETEMVTE